jgi:glycosyltransferase involved in cell wall biosynthesis
VRILTGIDVPFKPFGGSLLCANDWYSGLPGDVEVRFLTLPSPVPEEWWSIRDVRFMEVEKTRTAEGFDAYVRELQQVLSEQIADFQPDVIHAQHLNFGLSRAIAELKTTIPKIGICHGTDVQAAKLDPFFKDNMIRICDAMDALIFPNQTMADDLFTVYGKPKIYFIYPLGIPDKYYSASVRDLSFEGQRPMKILYAGRLLGWKGADIAVESLAHTRHDFELTIVGNEDERGYLDQLHHLVTKHGLDSKVDFREQLSRAALLALFGHYDAIVFPSRSLEAFSLTVVEAQANGLPVISSQGGGITETVADGGILVEDNSPTGLARILDEVYEQPERLKTAQAAGYKNALKYRASASQRRLFALSRNLLTEAGTLGGF